MRTLRIILGILFFIVALRGIVLLGSGNGNIYPVAAITVGVAGCLVMIFMKGKHGGE